MKINGDYIKAYRRKHYLTQQELADLLETQRCTITNWELGKHKISRLSVFKIKQKLCL